MESTCRHVFINDHKFRNSYYYSTTRNPGSTAVDLFYVRSSNLLVEIKSKDISESIDMGNRIGGDGVDYSVADSRSWLGAADAVPPDAWVLTVYLIGCKELVYGMSGDLGGRADPYLNLRLSKTSAGAEAFGGQQAQRSSRKSSTLDPRWMPPEPFTFIIPADMIPASAGGTSSSTVFPALVLQVMDWDLFSSHDEMGHCALSLADLIIGNPVDASQQKKKATARCYSE